MRTVALVRNVPSTFADRALRMKAMQISQNKAIQQHAEYCNILRSILGKENIFNVQQRDEEPDSLFVEDTAIVLRPLKRAIILTPGAPERRNESKDVSACLAERLEHFVIQNNNDKETVDGGDVLFTGSSFVIGISKRTSPLGALRLTNFIKQIQPFLKVEMINVPFGLHLKSICSMYGPSCIVVSQKCDRYFLKELNEKSGIQDILLVPEVEAANCLWIPKLETSEHFLVIRKDFPRSNDILLRKAEELKITKVFSCDFSEIGKADGALTCCSIITDL